MGPAARLDGRRRTRPRRALPAGAAVVVLAGGIAALVLARGGGDDDPPEPLPLAGYTAASTEEYEREVAEDLSPGTPHEIPVFRYVPDGELPALGGKAPAYRVTGDPGRAEF